VTYLSTGRDLLRDRPGEVARGGAAEPRLLDSRAVVVSDPGFGAASGEVGGRAAGPEGWMRPTCAAGPFDPLPRSREEGRAVARLLETRGGMRVESISGLRATETAVKRLNSPRVLHLATHGFFCGSTEDANSEGARRPVGRARGRLDNPLLRAGLALAGANRSPVVAGAPRPLDANAARAAVGDDGLLTALEISGLDLTGTELVVLSACETGMGDVETGEGVFGLRRAFHLAGVNSILMSLWAVPDRETAELMERFYGYWLEGRSGSPALRRAALDMLEARRREKGMAHPLFWGGFILAGGYSGQSRSTR